MPDLYFVSTHSGAQQLAYLLANLHQLPQKGTHVGRGPHVDMPEEYTPGLDHIGWSVRPYAGIRRLHPTVNSWGVLFREDTQALWADEQIRTARLGPGQIASFTDLVPTAKALDAAWNAGVAQAERHQVGEAHINKFGADPDGIGNSTAALAAAIVAAGVGGKITGLPGDYKIDPNVIVPLAFQEITGGMRFFASGPGDWLLFTNNVASVSCTWDGMNVVRDCIFAFASSLHFTGHVTQAVRHGLYVHLGLCYINGSAQQCGSHGFYFHGANATRVDFMRSILNGGYGFEAVGSFDPVLKAADPLLTSGGIFIRDAVLELNALGPFRLNGVEGGMYANLRSEGGGKAEIRLSHGLVVDYHSRAGASLDPDHAFVVIDNSLGIELRALYCNPGAGPQTFPRVELRGSCPGLDPASSIRYWSHIVMNKLPIVQEHTGTCDATSGSNVLTAPNLSNRFPMSQPNFAVGQDIGRRIVVPAAGIDGTITSVTSPGGNLQIAVSSPASSSATGTLARLYRPWVVY